ncbi:ferric reductase-like transmembrane domain-containing protein [Psychromonas sp. KJ10-10]|uniref:ferredoxin reductase family protein n=1 Tax=Psychromonas sp. KJ10-10 TaxID=3391823 RepID=UPI0039B5419D
MKRIKSIILATFVVVTLLWAISVNFEPLTWSYFSIRVFVVQYSGIMAISAMSILMILALRLSFVEKLTQGLDKSYRLHKWLGIGSLVFVIVHWFWAKVTKYMVGLGILDKPVRGGGLGAGEMMGQGLQNGAGIGASGQSAPDAITIESIFGGLRHSAELIGEWGFYLLIILMVIALVDSIRYSKFLNTHKVMSVVYLVFVFHAAILTDFNYWSEPIGWLVATFMTMGSIAAIYSLTGQIGKKNKVQGKVETFNFYAENRVLDITINTDKKWQGHHPGQFAFVKFVGEEAHPFTIASVMNDNGKIRFQIKAIGDFTNNLNNNLKINDDVMIEGPYGQFNFKSETQHQIWVAGGIGIAAFTAQMESLVLSPQSKTADLFYCTQCPDPLFIEQIQTLAKQANINFHLIDTNVDGFLTAEKICEKVSAWKKADVWFCGPNAFAKSLQERFATLGLSENRFHNELFKMR